MKIQPNTKDFDPLTTEDWLTVKVTKCDIRDNIFDKGETQNLNVELTVTDPFDVAGRKAWVTLGLNWPQTETKRTTKLFDFVAAFDTAHAVRGQAYDTDQLLGKYGRILMKNSDKTDVNGNIKQRVDRFAALKGGTPTAVPAAAGAPGISGQKVKL